MTPFFDIYNEAPSSVSGSFGNVRTVSELDSALGVKENMMYSPKQQKTCAVCSVEVYDYMFITP